MTDSIAAAQAGSRNHGGFVSAVADLTNDWVKLALITGAQKGAVQRTAAGTN